MRYKRNNGLSYQTSDSLVGYYAYSASTKMRFKPRVRHYLLYLCARRDRSVRPSYLYGVYPGASHIGPTPTTFRTWDVV